LLIEKNHHNISLMSYGTFKILWNISITMQHLNKTLATCVRNICNIYSNIWIYFATCTWNPCNILLKQPEHVEHTHAIWEAQHKLRGVGGWQARRLAVEV
jgi:hypothetical protein